MLKKLLKQGDPFPINYQLLSNRSELNYIFMGTPNIVLNRHCGRDPQSPKRERPSSRIGDGGCFSAMTVKCKVSVSLLSVFYVN